MQTPVLGRPVSGSKPRKHITKISYNNPSLVSNSVTALFKYPVSVQMPEATKPALYNKYTDSLSKAEHEFVLRKDQQLPRDHTKTVGQPQPQQQQPRMPMQRRFSSPLIQTAALSDNKYNFLNHQSIKTKQSHGYNIINCFPQQN